MDRDIFISTNLLETGERSDFWKNIAAPLFEVAPFPGYEHLPLEGGFLARQIGPLLGLRITFNNQIYHRTRRTIVQGGLDHYLVQIVTSGSLNADCNDLDICAATGDIFIVDLTQTYKVRAEAGSRITFDVPRQTLERALHSKNIHGIVLKATWPMTKLLFAYFQELFSHGAELPYQQALDVYDATIALLAAAIAGDENQTTASHARTNGLLRQRALEFIRYNIDQPNLTPEHIARRLNVSRSHLYRAFAGDGGVAKVLRNQRLDAAFLELTRSKAARGSISDLAYRLGFSSGNQLLRAFIARFGATPSDVQAGKAQAVHNTEEAAADLWSHCMRLQEGLSLAQTR